MGIIGNFLLITLGFVILIKGADMLVSGASSLAKRFNISDIAIGLTVVAMGTSAPELVVNIISGTVEDPQTHTNEVVFGNILGSNIFNTFLILGIASIIFPLKVEKNALWKELPFSLLITIIFFFLVNDSIFFDVDSNTLSRFDGVILLILFLGFLIYIFFNLRRVSENEIENIEIYGNVKTILFVVIGITGLIFGGRMIVDNAIKIAEIFQVSNKIIGLTIIAAGTSLPELATTVVAAIKKKSDIAIGSIVGSNIFNLLLVLGITSIIHAPLTYNLVLNTDLIFFIFGTTLLFLFMFTINKNRLDRPEGITYLIGFIAYFFYIFYREGIIQ